MLLFVQFSYHFSPSIATRFSEFPYISGKWLSEHLVVEAGEFRENSLEEELFGESESWHAWEGNIVELGALGSEDVVITDVAGFFAFGGDNDASSDQICLTLPTIIPLLTLLQLQPLQAIPSIRIKTNSPTPRHYKVNLRHISLLLQNIPVISIIQKFPRHETKSHFIRKIRIKFLSQPEKGLERGFLENVFKQELTHDVVLYVEGDAVEVFFFL